MPLTREETRVAAEEPTRTPTTDDFVGGTSTTLRSTGFQYAVTRDSLIGYDRERPELGRVVVSRTRNIVNDKLLLMWNLCRGLTDEQKQERVYVRTE